MRLPALFLTALLAMPAVAQTVPAAGDYAVDSNHTQLSYTVNHLGISDYTGQFVQPTGTLHYDPAHPAQDRVEIVFKTDNMVSTTPALDKHMKSADFFDTAKYPDARFISTKVVVSGRTALITGDLTLHGITRPVVLSARFVGAGTNPMSKKANIGFAATATIKRSDFGVSFGVPMVSDEVRLAINAAFEAK